MNKSTIERGYPLLADISGFVPFVMASEIEHANEIIQELLEFIIKKLKNTFIIAQIDGDSVFSYAPQKNIPRGRALRGQGGGHEGARHRLARGTLER